MDQPKPSDSAPEQPPEKPTGLQALLNGVLVVPAVVIPMAAITVLVMLGFIGLRVVRDGGLMPRPTALDTYSCMGFASPLQLGFAPPVEIVFDDARALRVVDASQTVRTERVCERLQ